MEERAILTRLDRLLHDLDISRNSGMRIDGEVHAQLAIAEGLALLVEVLLNINLEQVKRDASSSRQELLEIVHEYKI